MNLLATFWSDPSGSNELRLKLILAFLGGLALVFALTRIPTRSRRPIVVTATFLAGLYWVAYFLWPTPFNRQPNDLPLNAVEGVAFWLEDAKPVVGTFANILTAFLLGLGVYSILRIHLGRFFKRQRDWGFSLVLLISLFAMVFFGYVDWYQTEYGPQKALLVNPANWGLIQYGRDLLFDGLLQEMDAAMFSLIAFFILSAAYRAFRIRSIEATILLATALIVMLSLMGAVDYVSSNLINNVTGNNPDSFLNNLKLGEIARWLQQNVQSPGLRAIDFGIGIGALAMGLRLWLSLEKGGVSA